MADINEAIELCRSCAMDQTTLDNMTTVIIPSLERELLALNAAKKALTNSPDHAHWDSSGINDDIEKIEAAISHFEWRVESYLESQRDREIAEFHANAEFNEENGLAAA